MLEEWKVSGMTIRAFANLKGVSEHSLYGWRRELQMREREAALAEGRAPDEDVPRFASDARGRVLTVRFKDSAKSSKKSSEQKRIRNQFLFMTPEERRSFWFPHVEEFERSGLSSVEFCRLNGFNTATFSEWRRRYKKERVKWKQAQREKEMQNSDKVLDESLTPGDFISVSLIESKEATEEAASGAEQKVTRVQYRNTSGEVIEVTAQMQLAETIEIIKEMKNSKC